MKFSVHILLSLCYIECTSKGISHLISQVDVTFCRRWNENYYEIRSLSSSHLCLQRIWALEIERERCVCTCFMLAWIWIFSGYSTVKHKSSRFFLDFHLNFFFHFFVGRNCVWLYDKSFPNNNNSSNNNYGLHSYARIILWFGISTPRVYTY